MKRTAMHFEIYRRLTLVGYRWRWRLRGANGEIIASGEDYKNKADCEHAIDLVQSASLSLIEWLP